MPDYLPVDVELLVVGFLQNDTEVRKLVKSTRDVFRADLLPSNGFPLIGVHLLFAAEVSGPRLWLVRSVLQIDIWGGPITIATQTASVVWAALNARLQGTHSYSVPGAKDTTSVDGVVSSVVVSHLGSLPDRAMPPSAGSPRPHRGLSLDMRAHPVPVSV